MNLERLDAQIKPLPPYAHSARLVAGRMLWIRCGQRGWKFMQANAASGECVFPGTAHASAYRWPVKGLECWIVGGDCPIPRIAELVIELLKAGAAEVHWIDRRMAGEGSRTWYGSYYDDGTQANRRVR